MLATSLALTSPRPAQDLEDIIGESPTASCSRNWTSRPISPRRMPTRWRLPELSEEVPQGHLQGERRARTGPAGRACRREPPKRRPLPRRGSASRGRSVWRMQRELTRLGYSTGGTDGVWGRNTRTRDCDLAARDRKEKVTGYVTEAQLKLLTRGVVVVASA